MLFNALALAISHVLEFSKEERQRLHIYALCLSSTISSMFDVSMLLFSV